ncbi:hypothetical protein [Rheinheimera soli]|uniref:Uncharacterized protein n=1 Tax=Rheinheimera soli TaxID=443616 RepID=A0ABU1W2U3_9GAMM|nr:hypothetical protein [Rheinheimera soli]MDR7122244.1 hypothetical protein [Rheinheimera soli]
MSNKIITKFPAAKTNSFKLPSEPAVIIKALLNDIEKPLSIDFFTRSFQKDKSENLENFYKRIHREAQKLISDETGVVEVKNRYSWLKRGNSHYFFYITDTPKPRADLFEDIISLPLEPQQVIQSLLTLRFSCFLFSKISEEFILSMTDAQSELLLFADVMPTKNQGTVYIEALQLDLFFSKYNELFFNLSVKSFLSNVGKQKLTSTDDGGFLFLRGSNKYFGTRALDARKSRNKKFVVFQRKYKGCINYAQQHIHKYLVELFNKLKIVYQATHLSASDSVCNFLTLQRNINKYDLNIINNCPGLTDSEIYEHFALTLGECFHLKVLTSNTPASVRDMDEDAVYLFLNKELGDGKDGGSIINVETGEKFQTFWQAYRFIRSNTGSNGLDLYTKIKIENFSLNKKIVCQGLNLVPLESGNIKSISKHVINRIITEIALKKKVFNERLIECNEPLRNGDYEAIYIRRPEGMFYASITSFKIKETQITITEQRVIADEDELKFNCGYLDVVGYLRNDSFYLYDKVSQSLLTAYTSPAIPQIIGNALFDNAERYREADDNLRKLTAEQENPLPYYINPSKSGVYHQTFIFDDAPNYFYFVAPKGNPQSSFDRQLRVYNILVWNHEGHLVRQANDPITKLYLESLTDDILKNNQVSKTSLFSKIARLPIEN